MAKLQEGDFYYGAVLSMLINDKKGLKIMLVEGGKNKRVYDITANDDDFKVLIKYCSKPTTTNDDSFSWRFNLTSKEVEKIQEYMQSDNKFSLGLVCGCEQFKEAHYAVVQKNDIKKIFEQDKTGFTIRLKKGKHSFDLIAGHKSISQLKTTVVY